ncbi:MAG: bifunctional phosphopantothenoylcysteine decarboxylase/phosphopantothenate--cysteine ligase CoaBC [Chloroflexota bacterium]|nr:MAG: bifunctional phosphopantothenoylcysteine decarboxylase/phosphopantothenate--cysteine ligase CoaBC [Chloroflexota bacterium]
MNGRNVVLGVTGSIAAYKAVALASALVKAGALVDVVMTGAAQRFVTPLSFQAITHRPVVTDLWAGGEDLEIGHVTLGRRADVVVIAPATADTIARLAHGLAGDALGTTVLATDAPIIVAPAMEPRMWSNAATVANVAILRQRGILVLEPDVGRLASGYKGRGRMPEPDAIFDVVSGVLARGVSLRGRIVVVTAGGTREPIDPVRFIGNHSSGKMGIALAEAARDRGASVILVHGALSVQVPAGVDARPVGTTREMADAIHAAVEGADALIMAAAPADFRVARAADQKIKRGAGSMSLELVANPDILASLASWPGVKIGFAAETTDLIANARSKVAAKRVHMIVANDVTAEGSGFGADTNEVAFIFADGRVEPRPLETKRAVADAILDVVASALQQPVEPSTP